MRPLYCILPKGGRCGEMVQQAHHCRRECGRSPIHPQGGPLAAVKGAAMPAIRSQKNSDPSLCADRFQSTGAAAAPRRARAMPPAAPAPSTPGDDLAAAAAALDAISLPNSGRRHFIPSLVTCAHGACTAHGRTPALSCTGVRAPHAVARAQNRAGKMRRSGRQRREKCAATL